MDLERGMQTGWVLIDGKWHYFHPTSDGRKGILYVGRLTPDGYYVDEKAAAKNTATIPVVLQGE